MKNIKLRVHCDTLSIGKKNNFKSTFIINSKIRVQCVPFVDIGSVL